MTDRGGPRFFRSAGAAGGCGFMFNLDEGGL
jgi:hypothetical protein